MVINTKSAKKITNLCGAKRSTAVRVGVGNKEEFQKNAIARKVVLAYKHGAIPREKVNILLDEEFSKANFFCEETREICKETVRTLVSRYLDFDSRTCALSSKVSFPFEGNYLDCEPDFIYESKILVNKVEYPLVEVVCFSAGKNKYSNKKLTDKSSVSLTYMLEALAFLLLGKQKLGGKAGVVRVVYDSLYTEKDKEGEEAFKVCSSGTKSSVASDNRVYIERAFDESGKLATSEPLSSFNPADTLECYRETLEEFVNGIKPEYIKESDCTNCELFEMCKGYSKAPVSVKSEVVSTPKVFALSEEQRKVVAYRNGMALVMASAGSGKTQVVATRIAYMLSEGVKPEDILLISFSTSAVKEMRDRVKKIAKDIYKIDCDFSKIKICSFNSLGNEIINNNLGYFGFTEKPKLVDAVENIDLVREAISLSPIIDDFDYKDPYRNFGEKSMGVLAKVKSIIDVIRRRGYTEKADFIKDYESTYSLRQLDQIWAVYEKYVELLRAENYIDYSDQSNLISNLIYSGDERLILKDYNFKHIVVDEFQDSNETQIVLLDTLCMADKFSSIMFVGDDAQAIYGFLDATPENIHNLSDILGEKIDNLSLTTNYRSSQEIVELGDQLKSIYCPTVKKATSFRGPIGSLPIVRSVEKKSEFKGVAERIKEKIDSGVAPSDIAFICHNRGNLAKVQKELTLLGVPSEYDMPESYLSNSKVKAFIGFCEYLIDTDNTKGLSEYLNEVYGGELLTMADGNLYLKRNIKSLEQMFENLEDNELLEFVLTCMDAIKGEDNTYKDFAQMIKDKAFHSYKSLAWYVAKISKYKVDLKSTRTGQLDCVSLVTTHSSKGKEWKYVFASLTDFKADISRNEETNRLLYVLVTRAKDYLDITVGKPSKGMNPYYGKFLELAKLTGKVRCI